MVEVAENRYRHFVLEGVTEKEEYRFPGGGGEGTPIVQQNRAAHGGTLRGQLEELRSVAASAAEAQRAAGMSEESMGLQVEFESFPEIELAVKSLERENSGIHLLNVRHSGDLTQATVFVPEGKLDHFERLIRDYLSEKRDKRGHLRDNGKLLNAIRQIREASLRALWTDDPELFPTDDEGPVWWEVWLPIRGNRQNTIEEFQQQAEYHGVQVAQNILSFPERSVLLVHASAEAMRASMVTLNGIAEIRRPKETAEFFDALARDEQLEWLNDLLNRIQDPSSPEVVPYVCLLDTGVNQGHGLLSSSLDIQDLHTVRPAWGTADQNGHGTQMAGLALLGDLTELLANKAPIEIRHRLESVKLLPQNGATGIDPYHHGYLTMEAVERPEVNAPFRRRIFGMTITARDNRDRGRPSAWSAALDSLAADVGGDGNFPRLLAVSAGNIKDMGAWALYPSSNDSDGVHDPAQAWNVLTVGACTDLVKITEPGTGNFKAIAPKGGLSPFSTTSVTWQPNWPLKPDVVLEGGNAARDSLGAVSMPSLSLLTTNHLPADRLFTTANATSAATALAARLAARLMAAYPELWPETVRALIVHSAEWTETMKGNYLAGKGNPSKDDYQKLLRRCGFGVPNLGRALWSVANSLVMVIQESLHPFKRETGKEPQLCEMDLHHLPWPLDALQNLGEAPVEMRVTLSYFIEPNPSARGMRSPYHYESHGLRFDVKRPTESLQEFRKRVNRVARGVEKWTSKDKDGDSSSWLIGVQGRHRGSLHGDIWRGTAADLASRGYIAVCPTSGWWKTRKALHRYDKAARYALVVSITAPEVEVDLYTEVANQIGVPIESISEVG